MSKKKLNTDPLPGTNDFEPKEQYFRRALINNIVKVCKTNNFQEYSGPSLEPYSLFERKTPEDIQKQMYIYENKDGSKTVLRPELTPSFARIILKNPKRMYPIKWYSLPTCWRYEMSPTPNRKREFLQWNVDIVGEPSINAEAELISCLVTLLEKMDLTADEIVIKISDRRILPKIFDKFGIPEDKYVKVSSIIDKCDKLSVEELLELLYVEGIERAEELLDYIKNISTLEDIQVEFPEVTKDVTDLLALLDAYGLTPWITFDLSIIRGLAYYTGIVFEAFSRTPGSRALAGGGRFDNLLKDYGARQTIPACGFGLGDCVLLNLLKEKGKISIDRFRAETQIDYLIVPFSQEFRAPAVNLLTILRNKGIPADIYLKPKMRLKQAYSYADRLSVPFVILFAPDEWAENKIRVKSMLKDKGDSKENVVKLKQFVNVWLKSRYLEVDLQDI